MLPKARISYFSLATVFTLVIVCCVSGLTCPSSVVSLSSFDVVDVEQCGEVTIELHLGIEHARLYIRGSTIVRWSILPFMSSFIRNVSIYLVDCTVNDGFLAVDGWDHDVANFTFVVENCTVDVSMRSIGMATASLFAVSAQGTASSVEDSLFSISRSTITVSADCRPYVVSGPNEYITALFHFFGAQISNVSVAITDSRVALSSCYFERHDKEPTAVFEAAVVYCNSGDFSTGLDMKGALFLTVASTTFDVTSEGPASLAHIIFFNRVPLTASMMDSTLLLNSSGKSPLANNKVLAAMRFTFVDFNPTRLVCRNISVVALLDGGDRTWALAADLNARPVCSYEMSVVSVVFPVASTTTSDLFISMERCALNSILSGGMPAAIALAAQFSLVVISSTAPGANHTLTPIHLEVDVSSSIATVTTDVVYCFTPISTTFYDVYNNYRVTVYSGGGKTTMAVSLVSVVNPMVDSIINLRNSTLSFTPAQGSLDDALTPCVTSSDAWVTYGMWPAMNFSMRSSVSIMVATIAVTSRRYLQDGTNVLPSALRSVFDARNMMESEKLTNVTITLQSSSVVLPRTMDWMRVATSSSHNTIEYTFRSSLLFLFDVILSSCTFALAPTLVMSEGITATTSTSVPPKNTTQWVDSWIEIIGATVTNSTIGVNGENTTFGRNVIGGVGSGREFYFLRASNMSFCDDGSLGDSTAALAALRPLSIDQFPFGLVHLGNTTGLCRWVVKDVVVTGASAESYGMFNTVDADNVTENGNSSVTLDCVRWTTPAEPSQLHPMPWSAAQHIASMRNSVEIILRTTCPVAKAAKGTSVISFAARSSSVALTVASIVRVFPAMQLHMSNALLLLSASACVGVDYSDPTLSFVDDALSASPSIFDAPLSAVLSSVEVGRLSVRRTTVLSNLLFWSLLAGAIVAVVGVGVIRKNECVEPKDVLSVAWRVSGAIRMPGLAALVYLPLLQQTSQSSIQLLAYGDRVADIAAGVAGLAACCVGACGVLYLLLVLVPHGATCKRQRGEMSQSRTTTAARLLHALTNTPYEWASRKASPLFVEHFGALFSAAKPLRHWWLVVELTVTMSSSVAAAVVPTTMRWCKAQLWVLVGINTSQLVAVIAARPMQAPAELISLGLVSLSSALVSLLAALEVSENVLGILTTITSCFSFVLIAIAFLEDRRSMWLRCRSAIESLWSTSIVAVAAVGGSKVALLNLRITAGVQAMLSVLLTSLNIRWSDLVADIRMRWKGDTDASCTPLEALIAIICRHQSAENSE